MAQFNKILESENFLESKVKQERYLSKNVKKDNAKFELLTWWKINSIRYRVLSKVARDILGERYSYTSKIYIVASKLAFSTTDQVLDHFGSNLSPIMVEALICVQN